MINLPNVINPMTVEEFVSTYEGWEVVTHHTSQVLHKQFSHANFSEAFAFMMRVARIAEQLNHHPNWSNVYNTVDIALFTHEQDAITELDIEFAQRVEAL